MEIRIKHEGDIVVLYVEGNLNIDSAPFIEITSQMAKDGYNKFLCSLKGTEIVDQNGLVALSIAYKNIIDKKSVMKFCEVPMHIRALFRMSRLDLVFDIYGTEESAIRAFKVSSKIDELVMRRKFERFDMGSSVHFHIKGRPGKKMRGKILNISASGLFIYTKHLCPAATDLKIEIYINKELKFTVSGRVVWLADKQLQPHSYPGMGIHFLNMMDEDERKIITYIDKNVVHRSSI